MDCLGLEKLLSDSHMGILVQNFSLLVCSAADLRMELSVVCVLGKSSGPGPHLEPSGRECQWTGVYTLLGHGCAL